MTSARSRGRTVLLISLCLALPAVVGAAMDFQEMLSGAVDSDARVKALSGVLANTMLSVERARLAPGFQMKLSTGEMRFGYSLHPEDGDPPWLVSLEPSGALVLGRKTETQVNVQVPLAVQFGDGTEVAVLPRMSIRQPLDKLFGGKKLTEVQERESRFAVEKARIDVLKRAKELEKSLLDQLAVLNEIGAAGGQLTRDLSSTRDALDRAKKLGTPRAGSVQLKQLEFAALKLQRELDYNGQRRSRAWKELERLVGKTVDGVPADLPEPSLILPKVEWAERNPDVYLAKLSIDVESARLEEKGKPARPKFFLGGAVSSSYSEVKDRTFTTVGGNVEGVFDDFSFSAGVGSVVETGTLFLSAGLNWSLPDRRIESLELRERENTLDISRWNFAVARETFLSALEILALEIQDLDLQRKSLAEDRVLAEQRLDDAARSFEQGFSTENELETLRWEREKLELKARSLRLKEMIVRNRLDAMVALDGEKS